MQTVKQRLLGSIILWKSTESRLENEAVLMFTGHSLRRKTGMQSNKFSAERENMLTSFAENMNRTLTG